MWNFLLKKVNGIIAFSFFRKPHQSPSNRQSAIPVFFNRRPTLKIAIGPTRIPQNHSGHCQIRSQPPTQQSWIAFVSSLTTSKYQNQSLNTTCYLPRQNIHITPSRSCLNCKNLDSHVKTYFRSKKPSSRASNAPAFLQYSDHGSHFRSQG
ncbi:UNVERIFIED_CONTAM: hypothetical protein FKN15_074807 [Acipenser sinensis]